MYRPRIIPVLLLRKNYLVKTVRFQQPTYIGDPINAVRIFNDCKADELVLLDMNATREQRLISTELLRDISEEAQMPFAAGGGIRTLDHIREVIAAGAEKVILQSEAMIRPEFIREAADAFGSSSITVCMDVKKNWLGKLHTYSHAGTKKTPYAPVELAQRIQQLGAGELLIQCIDRDGMMNGYDLGLLNEIARAVDIPVVALGGAGSLSDLQHAYTTCEIQGLAAGSLFVYNNKNKGVLINYPDRNTKKNIFQLPASSLR